MTQQSGVFLVNKPAGMSTNRLIQKIKGKLKVAKIGHAGTLDPLADGLVLVLVNQATKLSSFLLNEQKSYTATLKLFSATNTGDLEGTITTQEAPKVISQQQLSDLKQTFNNYQYLQQAPIYSAIKVQGQKLYQHARNNEAIIPPKRDVTIHQFKVNNYNSKNQTLKFTTTVSKGTYIRSLGEDLAKHLSTVGHLTQLTRTQSGNFNLNKAKTWEVLNWNDLINLYDVLTIANYPIIHLDHLVPVFHGKPISLPANTPDRVFIANDQKEIVACYGRGEDHFYHCLRGGFINN